MDKQLTKMYEELHIDEKVLAYCEATLNCLKERFEEIDRVAEYNQMKVIKAMQDNKVSDIHFAATTGYGYNDIGRETLESVYANVFHAEDALVRPQITCGTHALTVALSANVRPGDEILSPVGKPYDTLEGVTAYIATGKVSGNILKSFKIADDYNTYNIEDLTKSLSYNFGVSNDGKCLFQYSFAIFIILLVFLYF